MIKSTVDGNIGNFSWDKYMTCTLFVICIKEPKCVKMTEQNAFNPFESVHIINDQFD